MDDDGYREETTWTIRLEAITRYSDDYDGEEDGFVWRERFHKEIQPLIAASVFRALTSLEGWKVRTGNRGLATSDELLIRLERDL